MTMLIALAGYAQPTPVKLDSIHQFSWDMTLMNWKHNTRDLYTYDNGGNKETNLLRLNLSGSVWENFYQFNKAYNGNYDLTESILQNWNGTMWVNGSRDTYTYNPMNLVATFTYAIYATDNWLTFNQNLYTYDTLGNLIEDLSKALDFTFMTLVNDQRKTYDYTLMQKNSEIVENWYVPTNMWDKDEKTDYTYNANGDVRLEEISAWQTVSMVWSAPYRQYIITYNTNDQVEEVLEQLFGSGMWNNSTRILNTYTDGKLTKITSQEWNSGTTMWDNSTRQLRTFDMDGNEIELIYETWDTPTMSWQGFLRQVKFWSPEEVLGNDNPNKDRNIRIYPNPTSQSVNIKSNRTIQKIQVFDLLGKQVLKTGSTNRLGVENLRSGIYVLKLTADEEVFTKKLVIENKK